MPEQQPDLRPDLTISPNLYGALLGPLPVRVGLRTIAFPWYAATMSVGYAGSFFERESHARTTT